MVHLLVLLLASVLISGKSNLARRDFVRIGLVDLPRGESASRQQKEAKPLAVKKPERPLPKKGSAEELPAPTRREAMTPERLAPPPARFEEKATFSSTSPLEVGGSEAGAGNLFGQGALDAVPGKGTAGGGGGTAAFGLGKGSGSPGLPAPETTLRTNRQAKPVQTVRAAYPPMALRMGLESDVTLKIEVDIEGRVIKAEIVKSGGRGFDDEALKVVKQSRFEPAQKDGKNVPAEFTYVYRFRLVK